MFEKLNHVVRRYEEITQKLSSGSLGVKELQGLSKEESQLKDIVTAYQNYQNTKSQITSNKGLLAEENDEAMKELIKNDLKELEEKLQKSEQDLKLLLIPRDPLDEKTDIGPMIDEASAKRVESWIEEAKQKGAIVLCGGKRKNNFIEPTVLTQVTPEMKVCSEEIFGPVVNLIPFKKIEDVYWEINQLPYGLQAGIFTNDLQAVFHAFETLDVGGVIVNEVPTYRADPMPYGGRKDSGLGREGVRYAIEEFTERKVLVFNLRRP